LSGLVVRGGVAEPERPLSRRPQRAVAASVRNPLKAVLRVVDPDRSEAFLELSQADRGASLAEVVGAAAVLAGQLDGPPLQQLRRADRTRDRPVDRRTRVVGGRPEKRDVRGDRAVVEVGDQHHQRGTEVTGDRLQFGRRVPARRPPARQCGRFMLMLSPAEDGRLDKLLVDGQQSPGAIHLATAQVLAAELGGSPVTFVTYDRRLLNAASNAALPTASPGI